jgi:predicted RND superfamily exporter protein
VNKEEIIKIVIDVENRPNSELLTARDILKTEFKKTKELIINLTRHMDGIEESYNKINNEIKKRTSK